jgi:hypothetical protein
LAHSTFDLRPALRLFQSCRGVFLASGLLLSRAPEKPRRWQHGFHQAPNTRQDDAANRPRMVLHHPNSAHRASFKWLQTPGRASLLFWHLHALPE